MSSKRGRKRNDNLPPNRARDVQRAFRARRAAHLQALEDRVTELEEENDRLRAALGLPPANRPPLGKGPTGKDKGISQGSRTDRDDSPSTSRTGSSSPLSASFPMSSLSQSDVLDTASWDKALILQQDDSTDGETSLASNRNLVSASPTAYQSDHSPTSNSSRSFSSNNMYISHNVSSYPRSSNRPASNWGQVAPVSRDQQSYSYSGSNFNNAYNSNGVLHPSASPTAEHGMDGLLNGTMQQSQGLAYGYRRSITESQPSRSVVDHYPPQYPQQTSSSNRTSSTSRLPPTNTTSTNASGYGGHEGLVEPTTHYPS